MTRKSKRRAAKRSRGPATPAAARPAGPQGQPRPPGVGGSARPGPAPVRVGGEQSLVRSVEMSLASQNQVVRRGRNRIVIESGDPAIPLDRVPYFTRDLIQLGLVGAIMIAILLVAAQFGIPLITR